jgi:hypothetical protein
MDSNSGSKIDKDLLELKSQDVLRFNCISTYVYCDLGSTGLHTVRTASWTSLLRRLALDDDDSTRRRGASVRAVTTVPVGPTICNGTYGYGTWYLEPGVTILEYVPVPVPRTYRYR